MSGNAQIIDDYLKVIYIDPLINDKTVLFVAEGDYLVHPYIQMLDEEIYSDPPISFSDIEIAHWEEDSLDAALTQFMDRVRSVRWAVLQFYSGEPKWRIFTKVDMKGWLTDKNDTVIGAEFVVHSMGGIATQMCIFGQNQCYLLKWKEGDNKQIFAYSDISLAMWTSASIARQIRNQLDNMGSKPEFPWVTYGPGVTLGQRNSIMSALDDSSITSGVGATRNAIDDIKIIPHILIPQLMALVTEKNKGFASLARLPFSFFNGEKDTQGFGDKGELIVEMQIDKKKQHIFNKSKPIIRQIYQDRYSITLTDIEMDQNEVEIQETEGIEEND